MVCQRLNLDLAPTRAEMTFAYSGAVTALSSPKLHPRAGLPVSFAAPRWSLFQDGQMKSPAARGPSGRLPILRVKSSSRKQLNSAAGSRAAEVSEIAPVKKEWPPFFKERFELADVDHCGIDFHLAEVGIDCSVQNQILIPYLASTPDAPNKRDPSLNGCARSVETELMLERA